MDDSPLATAYEFVGGLNDPSRLAMA